MLCSPTLRDVRRRSKQLLRDARSLVAIAGTRALGVSEYDLRDTIVVFGDGRSGTTWIAQTLASLPGAGVLFEPLHPKRVPGVTEAGFTWRTYVRRGAEWPNGRRLLEDAFAGRPLNLWTGSLFTRPKRVTRWIVKCIRGNRLVPWMSDWMQPRARVLVLRHPCAIVGSQIASDWTVPDAPYAPELLEDLPQIASILETCSTPEERRALDWAVNTIVALPSRSTWTTVCYEELVEGRVTFESMLDAWDLPVPEALTERSSVWSHTSRKRDRGFHPTTTVTEWTTQLTDEQVRRVLAVTHALGLDFYGEDPRPDLARLERWRAPS